MIMKKFILLFAVLFHATSLQTIDFTFDPHQDLQEQFDSYVALRQQNKLHMTALWTAITVGINSLIYLSDVYPQDSSLVAHLYPHAQQWYEQMLQKYPHARLDQKKFIQTKYAQSPSFCNIYFTAQSLRDIDQIYKKQLAGEELTELEQTCMKQNEFLILYQAGYIENNSKFKTHTAMTTSYIATDNALIPALKFLQSYPWFKTTPPLISVTTLPTKLQDELAPIYTRLFNDQVTCFDVNYSISSITNIVLFLMYYMPAMSNFFIGQAIQFACDQCHDDCLPAAIAIYETMNKPQFVTIIKNEMIRRNKA